MVMVMLKKNCLKKILDYFGEARKKREKLADNLDYIHEILNEGKIKANKIAQAKMDVVRKTVGLYK